MLVVRGMAVALGLLLAWTAAAGAQPYPNRIIKLIVPFPPAGVVDITGRLLAEYLQKEIRASIVVENRVGAGGTIGANSVARAEPDGYTILLTGAATHAFAPSLFKTLPYDPIADFVPITQVSEGPLGLVVGSSSDIKDLAGFVAAMKARGAASNYASNGYGTYPHLAMELFKQTAGIQITHVSFRGGNESITALLGAQVHTTFNHVPVILSHANAGTIRVLATSGASRSTVLPNVPTLKEAGHDVIASAWFGLFAPAKTSPEIVNVIAAGVDRVAKIPVFREKLLAQGDEVRVAGPASFLAYQRSELEKWTRVIGKAGIAGQAK